MKMFSRVLVVLVGAVGGAVSPAFAAGTGPAAPDLTSLVPDFSTVGTALIAIAGAVAIVYVTWKGLKMGLKAIRGG